MAAVLVPSVVISPRFLSMIGAPDMTRELAFKIEAGGVLKCVATYWVDRKEEVAVKEWEVKLERTSLFYKLINGDA